MKIDKTVLQKLILSEIKMEVENSGCTTIKEMKWLPTKRNEENNAQMP